MTLDAMPSSTKTDSSSKKQRRKEAMAEVARRACALQQLVRDAEADSDPLRALAAFALFERNGLAASIHAYTASTLPPALAGWALGLCRSNMRELYEPVWGWNDKKKRRQLEHESSRFLVAFEAPRLDGDGAAATGGGSGSGGSQGVAGTAAGGATAGSWAEGKPLAYINYRFELEEGEAVAYCYEVQLEGAAQRRGLGQHLMWLLELLAAGRGMARVMLTVMRGNGSARAFYVRLGYSEHESSPGAGSGNAAAGYEILHKPLPARRPAAAAAGLKAAGAAEAGGAAAVHAGAAAAAQAGGTAAPADEPAR